MFSTIKGSVRLCQIVFAVLRHGILPYTRVFSYGIGSMSYGQRVAACLVSLGPTFIKFGQSLAARVDVVGKDVAESLLFLCDKLPPFPYNEVVSTIEGQFNKKMDEIFLEFDEIPVAAASIAQVHRARFLDGKQKAVKVLRPGIESAFNMDINLMRRVAVLSEIFGLFGRFKLLQLVDMFSNICKLELDLRLEAASADELRENLKDDPGFYVPEVDWRYTTTRVLTLEWIDAIPIYKVDELECRESVVRQLIISFCNQVYRDRFFHADMHPGNLMVDADNRIIAVDFGIMGRLDEETAFYITEIFLGFLSRDYKKVAEAHYEAGYVPGKCDQFITACRAIWEPIADMESRHFSIATLLAQLFKVTADFNMCVQPKLLLLQKTMVLVEGVCRQLAPDMNFWKVAQHWVKEHYERDGCFTRLKNTKACRSMLRLKSFVAKIDKSLDVISSYDLVMQQKKARNRSRTTFCLVIIIIMLVAVIIIK